MANIKPAEASSINNPGHVFFRLQNVPSFQFFLANTTVWQWPIYVCLRNLLSFLFLSPLCFLVFVASTSLFAEWKYFCVIYLYVLGPMCLLTLLINMHKNLLADVNIM